MSRTKKQSIIFGGYDAKSCAEKIRKTYDPVYKDVKLDPNTPADEFRMARGVAKETEVGNLWNELYPKKIFSVDICDRSLESKTRREEQTLATMENPKGFKVIWNARLPQDFNAHRTGEPDALVLLGKNKETGKNIWIPVDVKDHKVLENESAPGLWEISTLDNPLYASRQSKELGKGNPQKVDALQLAHYHRMLEKLGYANDKPLGGIIGREGVILWHDLDKALYVGNNGKGRVSAMEYYDTEFNFRLDVAQNALEGVAITFPEWKQECQSCQFRTTCHDELEFDLDHISLLAGMNSKISKGYYDNNLVSTKDLASLDYTTAKLISFGVDVQALLNETEDMKSSTLLSEFHKDATTLLEHGFQTVKDLDKLCLLTAQLSGKEIKNLPDMIDIAKVKLRGKVHLARGINFVPLERAAIEEDIDIEDSDGIVYLIGVQTTERRIRDKELSVKATYHAFETWIHSDAGEARVFSEFWEHIVGQRHYAKSNKKSYRAYHYSAHERTAFEKLAKKHAGKPGIPPVEEVMAFMDSNEFIDMAPIVKNNLIWPTENHTLKTIAKWARFSWRDKDPGGGNSLAWYHDAVNHEEPEVREQNRSRIKDYNHDDVRAQIAIRNWFSNLGEAREPGLRMPKVENLKLNLRKLVKTK